MAPSHYAIIISYNEDMNRTEEQIKEGIDAELSTLPEGMVKILALFNGEELGTFNVDMADIGEWYDPDSSLYGYSHEAIAECIYHNYKTVLHDMP